MHTVELLEEAVALAKCVGYAIREEWLGGSDGGLCEINGKTWLFLDLASDPRDRLDQLLDAVTQAPIPETVAISPALCALLYARRVA